MMNFIDLFAGVGGFSEGFSAARAGGKKMFEPRLLVDKDRDAAITYRYNRPQVNYLVADVTDLTSREVLSAAGLDRGQLDCLIGGPPCQGFSALRRSKVVHDPRNDLIHVFVKLARSLKPKLIMMENVQNFPGAAGGLYFREFTHGLSRSYLVKSELLNSRDYGVPQWRKRTFVVGIRKDVGIEEFDFPILAESRHAAAKWLMPGEEDERLLPLTQPWVNVEEAIGDLPSLKAGQSADFYDRPPFSDYQYARRQGAAILCNHTARGHDDVFLKKLAKIEEGGSNQELDGRRRFDREREIKYLSQAYGRLHREGIAQTITAHFLNPGSGRFLHYRDLRSITVREAARFQSIDDNFVFPGNVQSQQRLVGNAVPPLMARALAEHFGNLLLGKGT